MNIDHVLSAHGIGIKGGTKKELKPPANLALSNLAYGQNGTISWGEVLEADIGYRYRLFVNDVYVLEQDTLQTLVTIDKSYFNVGDNIYFEVRVRRSTEHYGSEFVSSSVKIVDKGTQTPPPAPTISNLEFDRATVSAGSGTEVNINNGTWYDSPHTFTGLTAETNYTVYARKKETSTHYASSSVSNTFTTPSEVKIYGVKIDKNNSNPSTAVTYTDNAIGMTGGSSAWDSIYPFNQIRPVLYKNGTVVGELNKNDFSKFTNETNADITSGNAGDVMIEFPKIWWKFQTIGSDLYVKYATKQVDSTWKCLAHMRGSTEKDKVYIGAYLGFSDGSKLRSLSGKTPTTNQTIGSFRTLAKANGSGYDQIAYYQLLMLQVLFLIRYKSLDSQTALGRGYVDGNSTSTSTGGANTRGMNFGETTGKQQNKFCGIEDFWGNCYYWIDGLFSDANRNMLIGTQNFNDTGSGYTNYGQGATANLGGYISDVQGGTETGFIVKATAGSATTYYADYGNLYADRLPFFGGSWAAADAAGAFRLIVDYSASYAYSILGARLLAL